MSSYEKLKNDELKKLLTERNLPTTGKKADLVARLTESDTKPSGGKDAPSTSTVPAVPAAAGTASTLPSQPAVAAAEPAKPAAKNAAPTQTGDSANASTTSTTTGGQSAVSTPSAQDHAAREALLAKRAARFGIPKDEEEERRKARAARFGQSQQQPSSISSVLPEDKVLSQPKAKNTGTDKRKESKAPAAAKPAEAQSQQQQQQQQQQPEKRKVSVLDDPLEAEKARKRALKFGTASVSSAATQNPVKPPAAEIAST